MTTKAAILKDIRSFCVHTCCCEDEQYVKECLGGSLNVGVNCPLWPYRLAKDPNPNKKRVSDGIKNTKYLPHGSGSEKDGSNFDDRFLDDTTTEPQRELPKKRFNARSVAGKEA